MIAQLLFNVILAVLQFFADHLPSWHIWPSSVTEGLSYFVHNLISLNFLGWPIDVTLAALIFFFQFCSLLLVVKLFLKIFNR